MAWRRPGRTRRLRARRLAPPPPPPGARRPPGRRATTWSTSNVSISGSWAGACTREYATACVTNSLSIANVPAGWTI